MKFDDFDLKMRTFETASDVCVAGGTWMIARIDGRSFTRLTKDSCKFESPYDRRFCDLMVSTTKSLMQCGFHVVYGYVQSDEISLLFDLNEKQFGRKTRKFNSVLAGQASAHFSLGIGQLATFDCRVSQLPDVKDVVDYFRWRQQDAYRNALNSWCYWKMREFGSSARNATQRMVGMTVASKKQTLLHEFGIDFELQPLWQRHGVGILWKPYLKQTKNRLTGEAVEVNRRRIEVNLELPRGDDYSQQLLALISR
jgi:tRNA(His) 5'-end guanylyltransferase